MKGSDIIKGIQKYRFGVQILSLILTIASFFVNFEAAMIVILGLTIISGVFYCGWVCPFGFIQDLFSKLGALLGIKKRKMPRSIQKVLLFSRYIIFGLVLLVGTDLIFSIMSFDPRVNFEKLLLGNVIKIGVIIVIFIFSLVSLFFERPFCNYFCYEGAKYGLLSIFRPVTIKRNESKCVNCKKCDKVCPMNIEVSKCSNLRSAQCINCFECISSCPVKDTLNYGIMSMKNGEKKKYFSMLTASLVLIAVFLIYNIFNGTNPLSMKNHSKGSHSVGSNETIITDTTASTSDETKTIAGDDAKKLGDAAGIDDGIYSGEGIGFRGPMTVEVTVKNQQIVSIEVVKHREDRDWFYRANAVIPNSIIESQSTDVDSVSGATYSSTGIIDGVKDALEKAK